MVASAAVLHVRRPGVYAADVVGARCFRGADTSDAAVGKEARKLGFCTRVDVVDELGADR